MNDDETDLFRALAMSDDDELDHLQTLGDGFADDAALESRDEEDRLAPVDRHTLMRVKLLARAVNRPTAAVLDDLLRYAIRAHDVALDESGADGEGEEIETDGGTDVIVADDDHAEILD